MIRGRFLSRVEWEAKLRRWGCAPLDGKGPLNTAEWWLGPTKHPFTVPIEGDEDACDFWAIQHLCRQFGDDPALPFPEP